MRSPEHWVPPVTRHPVFEAWQQSGSPSLAQRARARCAELLDRDSPPIIDGDLDRALAGLLRK
jgi:trimethylamine:corrinoid methyltransferase-like protein